MLGARLDKKWCPALANRDRTLRTKQLRTTRISRIIYLKNDRCCQAETFEKVQLNER